jgi:hypothetical protein
MTIKIDIVVALGHAEALTRAFIWKSDSHPLNPLRFGVPYSRTLAVSLLLIVLSEGLPVLSQLKKKD